MSEHRAIVGLCVLFALLVSAFAAQSASAFGTTAVTCVKNGGNRDFNDAHCKNLVSPGTGSFGHVSITEKTSITVGNESTLLSEEPAIDAILKATIGGVATELVATGVDGTATMENKLVALQHVAHGTGTTTYTGVTVAKPAGKGCKVFRDKAGAKDKEGEVVTNELTATTEGPADHLKFLPKTGEVFATFYIDGCALPFTSLNKTYEVKGSVIGTPQGATTVFSHGTKEPPEGVTGQNTLNINGTIPAGFGGSVTFKGQNGSPLSATTVFT